MQQPKIPATLESRKRPNLLKHLKTVIETASKQSVIGKIKSVFGNKRTDNLLNSRTAELAQLLLSAVPLRNTHYGAQTTDEAFTYGSKKFNRVRELLGEKEWNNPDNFQVLVIFFGEEKASFVRYAWEQIRYQMYQTGYDRRSFRSPENQELYIQRQMEFLIQAIPQSYCTQYSEQQYEYIHFDLSLPEQVKWAHTLGDLNYGLFRLWSAAIDQGHQPIFQMLENIIYNKDEEGKVTRNIIKALLNSNKPEAWQLVEKLLLAAQRQEGLRQTILEALDETSIGALKYMIRVILDNQLTRFSSVVRAVDVWAGFGWESERESTVKSFLEKAHQYLEDPALIPQAVKSDNNADVYMALWAQGVYDIEKTLPYLEELYHRGNTEKRTLALLFAGQSGHYKLNMLFYYQALGDKELAPLGIAVNSMEYLVQADPEYYNGHYPDLFDKLHETYNRISVKEKTFESLVFSWQKFVFERKKILRVMIRLVNGIQARMSILLEYFPEMDAEVKAIFSHIMLPGYSRYYYGDDGNKKPKELSALQRSYAVMALKDRSEFHVAFRALENLPLTADEIQDFPDLLKRKSADFRNKLIELLLKQSDKIIEPIVDRVLTEGDTEQRLAGLDILLQLEKASRLARRSSEWITTYRERKNISAREEILLSQLTGQDKLILSLENGFGLFDPEKLSPIIAPAIDSGSFYEQALAKQSYGFSSSLEKIQQAYVDLYDILNQNSDREYDVHNWNNTRDTVLLGNMFRQIHLNADFATARERYENYPFPELWEAWYKKWDLTPQDLAIITLSDHSSVDTYKQLTQELIPNINEIFPRQVQQSYQHRHMLMHITAALRIIFPFEKWDEFCLGATNRLFSSLGRKTLLSKSTQRYYSYYESGDGWQSVTPLNHFLASVNLLELNEKNIQACWNLYHWRQFSGLPENIEHSFPPLMLFCRAFKAGIISEDEMYRGMLTPNSINLISSRLKHKNEYNYLENYPFLRPMFDRVRNIVLDIELKRGDTPTAATAMATSLQAVYGIDRFISILAGLGKTNLYRGYIFSSRGTKDKNKQESFSILLKRSQPLASGTQDDFNRKIKEGKIKDMRLIEAAVYAPQWQKLISGYLGWEGLDSAIWWMHAHTKTSAFHAQNAEAESEIARYSTIDIEEFKDGAVDKEWFTQAHNTIDEDKWVMVYDAAKYISDGNGHRRARIYADVLEGNLNLKDVAEKIQTKRDQDYLRIYGLVPLDKKNPEKDVLARYEYLQQFKKESRQFGSMKQSSEAKALQVAMDNLARNAGYPDPVRLTWAMETKQVQEILSKETQVQYDDVLIKLIIDKEGHAEVQTFKDDKPLKALPAKYKKDTKVEELNGFKKTLREQFKRARKGLEDAMVRGDAFLASELKNLFEHPVISKHLERLVYVIDNKNQTVNATGFYRNGMLIDAEGHEIQVNDTDLLRIAHCTDLYVSTKWANYQRYAFDQKLTQPFKQIFRELYLPTEDELKEKAVSRRYAGHQVQPKQTVALLKSRGWKVDYEEGLQKLFYKEGFIAKMYAMADWFSPAEVENPTLETVVFHNRKDYTNIEFSTINPRIFSEVMRDIDLVVSVAHAGGVDAEASHSSIEMRAVLLKETMRLFKIKNVEVSGSHAIIKGTMGEYSIHLGSAVAHKKAAGYLSIIPVHSQQRGRLFLPFADDDPKTAEMISKVLLLARDKDIQDPTVLRQLS